MTINEHLRVFAGLPVAAFDPHAAPPADPAAHAWRVDTDYDGGDALFALRLDALLTADWAGRVEALVVGQWTDNTYDCSAPIGQLVAAAGRLTGLRALFLGDQVGEESEISWIQQGDITALLEAYPALEVLGVRGGDNLELKPVRHDRLRELTIECGGLPASVVRALGESELPALTRLELWLGTEEYGGDATVDDVAPLLTGTRLPALRHLGLRNAEIVDHVAAALAGAGVVAQLETLDLSMGILTDTGASALLAGQPLTHLTVLDLHHHYLSEAVTDRITAELVAAGVVVDLSDAGDPDDEDERYIEVSE